MNQSAVYFDDIRESMMFKESMQKRGIAGLAISSLFVPVFKNRMDLTFVGGIEIYREYKEEFRTEEMDKIVGLSQEIALPLLGLSSLI